MDKSVRIEQRENRELLLSCLRNGTVLAGQIGVIIERCGSHSTGQAMAKYLQRAETMQKNPFRVNRTRSHGHGCMYKITLKKSGT